MRGCFWHHHGWRWNGRTLVHEATCRQTTTPKSNRAFWSAKFRRNVRRDAEHERLWAEQGWNVIVIWECGLCGEARRARTLALVRRWLDGFARAPRPVRGR